MSSQISLRSALGGIKLPGGTGPVVNATLTETQGSTRYAAQTPATMQAYNGTPTSRAIQIDKGQKYQIMDGFGAALTEAATYTIARLPLAARTALLNELFNPVGGLGISMIRICLGASDHSNYPVWTYDDMPAGQSDPSLINFSLGRDTDTVIPIIQAALAINPNLKIIAAPWSPPEWMKDGSSGVVREDDTASGYNGYTMVDYNSWGTLKPGCYQVYANYLVKAIQAYANHNINIDIISPQNEPTSHNEWPSLSLSSPNAISFIGQYLGPAFAAAHLTTRIACVDNGWNRVAYANAVFKDATAKQYTAGSFWHGYAQDYDASEMTTVHNANPTKDIWMTEDAANPQATVAGNLMHQMSRYWIGAPRNWAKGVVYWSMALDNKSRPFYTNRLPGHPTGGHSIPVVTIDASNNITREEPYYGLAHYAAVRPGSQRIDCPTYPDSVDAVCYLKPDNKTRVLLVACSDTSAQTIKIIDSGYELSVTLQPGDIQTLQWQI